MNNELPPPPSLLTLSPSLLRKFHTLSGGDVRTYKQMFIALWRWLWPISRLESIGLVYNLPVVLGSLSPRLSAYEWFALSKLYLLTSGGATSVNTRSYPFSSAEYQLMLSLMKKGIIVRTSFDPAHPYLVRPQHINKTYISLTPSGIAFYKRVVVELHKLSHKDVYLLSLGAKETGQ